jgi:hypothetical protein
MPRSEQSAVILAEAAATSDQRTSDVFRWIAELNDMSRCMLKTMKASRALIAEIDAILAKER